MKLDLGNHITNSNVGSPFFFEEDYSLEWHMTRNERYCFIALLEKLRPDVAIEIGTFKGGSCQVLSKYCKTVYSIDPKPSAKQTLEHKFNNVNFVTGYSYNELPQIFEKIDKEQRHLEFILIDGDHSSKSVRDDINLCLNYIPKKPVFIIFHDSFNPTCRKGIKAAKYHENHYVHYVELDFISGIYSPDHLKNQMWGGLALVLMLPTPRAFPLKIHESQRRIFDVCYFRSVHWLSDKLRLFRKGKSFLRRLKGR